MKKFFEAVKDFLYDSVDYIIVFIIIVVVVIIIGSRIDLLFVNGQVSEVSSNEQNDVQSKDNNIENEPILNTEEKDNNGDEISINQTSDTEETTNGENPDNEATTSANTSIIKISIPAGSLPSKIGNILEDKGLILSTNDFILKTQELKLDTKLKSGDFDISTDSTIEDIIYIISK